jgi:hypothetical protein
MLHSSLLSYCNYAIVYAINLAENQTRKSPSWGFDLIYFLYHKTNVFGDVMIVHKRHS